jgi:hypothetical protein
MSKNDALDIAVAFLRGYGDATHDQEHAGNMHHAADLLTEQAAEVERLETASTNLHLMFPDGFHAWLSQNPCPFCSPWRYKKDS